LVNAGRRVVVIDDLSAGHEDAVPKGAAFVRADVRDSAAVSRAIREHGVKTIVHFASRIQVGESVADPRKYWRDNLGAAVTLLETALDEKIEAFVLSSTAATYGNPIRTPIDEDHPTQPINPYGDTKLTIEKMLASYERAYGLRWVALRYFNASGAALDWGVGERHDPETHLIPLVLEAALGKRPKVTIFGDDFDTPDGTCIRDYVHILDLARAHVAAIDRTDVSGPINLGTGRGSSVREVVKMVEEVSNRPVPHEIGPRRAGDPPVLVASAARAERLLGWRADLDLRRIVRDAHGWLTRSR
jgi:UDP-glucose-4-epimerase GalE